MLLLRCAGLGLALLGIFILASTRLAPAAQESDARGRPRAV